MDKPTDNPGPHITKEWSDKDTIGAALYDDGYLMVFDEKSAALIDPRGIIVSLWWRDEPSGAHWYKFTMRDPHMKSQPISDETRQLIFDVGHHDRDKIATDAAKKLIELLK